MAIAGVNWTEVLDPFLDFSNLGATPWTPAIPSITYDSLRSATTWILPNRDGSATVFSGEGFDFHPITGIPTTGTINSVSLVVFTASFTVETMVTIGNIDSSITLDIVASQITQLVDLRNAASWFASVDQENASPSTIGVTRITIDNGDSTFTEFLGTDLAINGGALSGMVSEINHLQADETTLVVEVIPGESTVDLTELGGSPVSFTIAAGAVFSEPASRALYNLINSGDNVVTLVTAVVEDGYGTTWQTDLFDGAGFDVLVNSHGEGGFANYSGAAGAISVALGAGIVATLDSAGGVVDVDSLIGFTNFEGSEFGDLFNAGAATIGFKIFAREGDDTVNGGAGNDFIAGEEGNDSLDGGAGRDRISYGGSEVGVTVDLSVSTVQATGDGNDTIKNFEELEGSDYNDELTGDAGDNTLMGMNGDDTIFGGAGNDSIDGEDGTDSMSGGLGDDTYIVSDATDIVVEAAGEGTDQVRAQAAGTYTLAANIENLNLYQFSVQENFAANGIGNALNNVIKGNAAINTMTGGAGDDTYWVQNSDDIVDESAGQGVDKIQSNVTYSLAALAVTLGHATHVEVLELTGTTSINATGSDGNETITGNTGSNVLSGNGGNDFLFGGADGIGDTLIGGLGNDIYLVTATNDIIQESGAGTDTVRAFSTWTLGANLERLELQGAGAINGTGNSLNNAITGNAAANVLSGAAGADVLNGLLGNDTLNGGAGADVMNGGAGNDTYIVSDAGDTVVEAAGSGSGMDTVQASVANAPAQNAYTISANVENLMLAGVAALNANGNNLANSITGNAASNSINGGLGNDTLIGGLGNDTLNGGAGADFFVFNTAPNAATNRDTITGFVAADDTIRLENAIFTGITGAVGTMSANQLRVNTANSNLAVDADDHVIYNKVTGALFYDFNGNAAGGGIQIATLSAGLTLTNADFVII